MGAWGGDVFENDGAVDFAADVIESKNLSQVDAALDNVLQAGDELDADTASEGIAAADIVARLRGHFGQTDAYTEKLDDWVKKAKLKPSEMMQQKSLQVVERVRTAPSELLELWSEDDPNAWLSCLDALKQRLTEPPMISAESTGKQGFFKRLWS